MQDHLPEMCDNSRESYLPITDVGPVWDLEMRSGYSSISPLTRWIIFYMLSVCLSGWSRHASWSFKYWFQYAELSGEWVPHRVDT
jgi:hypothetical protein